MINWIINCFRKHCYKCKLNTLQANAILIGKINIPCVSLSDPPSTVLITYYLRSNYSGIGLWAFRNGNCNMKVKEDHNGLWTFPNDRHTFTRIPIISGPINLFTRISQPTAQRRTSKPLAFIEKTGALKTIMESYRNDRRIPLPYPRNDLSWKSI